MMLGSGPGRSGLIQILSGIAASPAYLFFGPLPPGTVVRALRVAIGNMPGSLTFDAYTIRAVATGEPAGTVIDFAAARPLTPVLNDLSRDAMAVYDVPLDFVATDSERVVTVSFVGGGANFRGFIALVLEPEE